MDTTSPPSYSPKPNRRTLILVSTFTIIVVGIIAARIFSKARQQTAIQTSTHLPTPQSLSAWSLHEIYKHDFSLKIPKNWITIETPTPLYQIADEKEGVWIFPDADFSARSPLYNLSDYFPPLAIYAKEDQISSKEKPLRLQIGNRSLFAIIDPNVSSEDKSTILQILSTLEPLHLINNKTDYTLGSINWRKYENKKLGFTLEHPDLFLYPLEVDTTLRMNIYRDWCNRGTGGCGGGMPPLQRIIFFNANSFIPQFEIDTWPLNTAVDSEEVAHNTSFSFYVFDSEYSNFDTNTIEKIKASFKLLP